MLRIFLTVFTILAVFDNLKFLCVTILTILITFLQFWYFYDKLDFLQIRQVLDHLDNFLFTICTIANTILETCYLDSICNSCNVFYLNLIFLFFSVSFSSLISISSSVSFKCFIVLISPRSSFISIPSSSFSLAFRHSGIWRCVRSMLLVKEVPARAFWFPARRQLCSAVRSNDGTVVSHSVKLLLWGSSEADTDLCQC